MKPTLRTLATVFFVALLASACSVDSGDLTPTVGKPSDASAQPSTEPTPTQVRTEPTPTTVPTPVAALTADEQVAAAIAEYDANPQPAGVSNWEHVGAEVLANDRVRLEVCLWDGARIFETRHLVEYRVERDATGAVATALFNNELRAACESQTLIDTLFVALQEYDAYWRAVLEDPQTFDPETARAFLAAELIELNSETLNTWIADDSYWQAPGYDGQLPGSAVTDVLWRRYENDAGVDVVDIVGCREMEPGFGLYQGDQLIDDFLVGEPGPHHISVYTLVRDGDSWIVSGQDPRSWADCTGFGDGWVDAINEWKPYPIGWRVLHER